MEYKNAHYSFIDSTDYIDCEINHPEFGWIPTTIPTDGSDPATLELRDQILAEVSVNDLKSKLVNGSLVPVNPSEVAAKAAEKAQQEAARQDAENKRAAKLAGVEFEGVMYSATKEDMWGLASVKDWVRGGASTNFVFDNGNTLHLTPENIDAFEAVWIPFRASFFQ